MCVTTQPCFLQEELMKHLSSSENILVSRNLICMAAESPGLCYAFYKDLRRTVQDVSEWDGFGLLHAESTYSGERET